MEEQQLLHNFSKLQLNKFGENFMYNDKPKIVQLIDNNGKLLPRPENLKYFKVPTTYPLDIKYGSENYEFHMNLYGNLRKLEAFCLDSDCWSSSTTNAQQRTQVLTQQCVLVYIMRIPYQSPSHKYNGFGFRATRFNGRLYLAVTPNDNGNRSFFQSADHEKFINYCSADSPISAPNIEAPIATENQIYSIYQNKLKDFDIFYWARITGIISDKEITSREKLNECRFVASKVFNASKCPWCQHYFSVQSLWLKALLSNQNDFFIGICDRDGFVRSKVEHIIDKGLLNAEHWDPEICFGHLNKVLSMIESEMLNINCPYTVYDFSFIHNRKKKCFEYKIHHGENELSFLSENFVKQMQEKQPNGNKLLINKIRILL